MRRSSSTTLGPASAAASAPEAGGFPADAALQGILENMLNGVAYCRMLFENGVAHDFVYLYTNRAFHQQTGLGPVGGKRASEIIGGACSADPDFLEICGRVAAGGQPEKFEIFMASLQAWFVIQAYSPEPDHFVTVFDVITGRKQREKELRLQALVLDQIQEQVTVTDLDGTVTYVNRAEAEALASPKDSRLGRHVSIYGDDPKADATQEEVAEATRRFGAWAGKVVNYRADGSPMLIDLRTTLVRDESGKPVAMVGVSTDITERHVAEATLRASEERYRRLHESLLDAFVLVDMAGCIREWNPVFQEMVGYSADELRQMSFYDLTPEKWHPMEARIIAEQIVPDGHSEVYAKEFMRKGGCVFPVELRTFLIRDRQARPEAMWAIVRDVSERRKSEARMQLAQQIFDNASEAIFVSDVHGNLLEVNAEACRLAKYTREEMLRLRNVDVVVQEDASRIAPELARCDAGVVVEQRWLLRCSDGSTVPLDLVAQRLPGGRYLAIGRDLTEREKVLRQLAQARDAAEQASRAKSHFLAAASHDLRQPILAINLFQDALGKTDLNPEQKQIADYLARSDESLSGILSELLEISRLDAGVEQPSRRALLAEEIFHRIDAEFSPLAAVRGLRFKFFYPQQATVLLTDRKMLLSLLRNLIDNAFKYTETGGVLVALRRRGDYAVIQVWDTGIGIAPAHIDAIFDEYFQVGNPQRDRASGLGLGLAIVRRLANALGCQISCRSRLARGSLFEFRVPLSDQANR